jgi:hypothetical protein
MDIIEIQTLVDITRTQVTRLSQGTNLQLDQNRNFITLMQCIELRSVVSYEQSPIVEKIEIKNLDFGSAFKGKQNVWTFRFSPDRVGVYANEKDLKIGALFDDLHAVPIIKNLTETINIDKAIFNLQDSQFKNTTIKAIQNN